MSKKNEKQMRKENFNFAYRFSAEELALKSKHLAHACEELNRVEEEKKSINSEFKFKIDSRKAEVNTLSQQISSGFSYITKECDVEYFFDDGIKIFYHEGEEVGREKLTSLDYQLKLNPEN